MTEYTTSPDAIAVFRNSKERTEYWVRSHSPFHGHFHSPESPPSVIEEQEARESDEESSHSLPPKMVLKYGDGRQDIPISHWHYGNANHSHRDPPPHHGSSSRPRPHTAYNSHDRSRSAADAYPPPHSRYHEHGGAQYRSSRHVHPAVHEEDFSAVPEEIHVLPSDPNVKPHHSTGTYRPRRSSEPFRPGPPQSSPHGEPETIEILETPAPRYVPSNVDMPPPVMYSHSQPIHDPYDHHHPSHSHSRGNRPPPSIVYAPGHHHTSDHYAPPTIVYAPHKAPGMTYTVSAPTGSGFPQYPRITPAPYPNVHSNLASVHEEPRYGGPRGPRPREDIIPRGPSPISEAVSADSGSTYYVIPTPGQKVKVLVGPEASLYTATSTTKSASSPRSPHSGTSGSGGGSGFKKPLFSRLLSFASDLSRSSKGSRSSKKNLQRRHSIDASARAHHER